MTTSLARQEPPPPEEIVLVMYHPTKQRKKQRCVVTDKFIADYEAEEQPWRDNDSKLLKCWSNLNEQKGTENAMKTWFDWVRMEMADKKLPIKPILAMMTNTFVHPTSLDAYWIDLFLLQCQYSSPMVVRACWVLPWSNECSFAKVPWASYLTRLAQDQAMPPHFMKRPVAQITNFLDFTAVVSPSVSVDIAQWLVSDDVDV
jgi:hypothetical protein